MANFRKLAMLAIMLIKFIDEYFAGVRYRQVARRQRPTWRRSVLPADPVRSARHYGLYPLRNVPRCRPVGMGRAQVPAWPGRCQSQKVQNDS